MSKSLEMVYAGSFKTVMGTYEMEIKNGDLKDKEIRMLTPSEGDLN